MIKIQTFSECMRKSKENFLLRSIWPIDLCDAKISSQSVFVLIWLSADWIATTGESLLFSRPIVILGQSVIRGDHDVNIRLSKNESRWSTANWKFTWIATSACWAVTTSGLHAALFGAYVRHRGTGIYHLSRFCWGWHKPKYYYFWFAGCQFESARKCCHLWRQWWAVTARLAKRLHRAWMTSAFLSASCILHWNRRD
jgi:hypothetical protein